MKNLCILLLLLSATPAFSQKSAASPKQKWQIYKIAYTSDSTGVALLDYNEKRSGIVFLSQDGSIQKELPLPGEVWELAQWRGKVLAFYCDTWGKGWTVKKNIHALLIDPGTKAIVGDQLIYNNESGNMLDCTVNCDHQGNFHFFLVRTTGQKGDVGNEKSWKEYNRLRNTVALSAVYFSDSFKPVVVPLTGAAIGADIYLGNYSNKAGEIGIVSFTKGVITAEKFGRDGKLQKTVTCPFEYSSDYWDYDNSIRGMFSPNDKDALVFSVANPDDRSRHRNIGSFVFDFASGQTKTLESVQLNKDYFRSFKNNPDLEKTKHFKEVEAFRPAGIFFIGDTLVVTKEIRYEEIVPPPSPVTIWHGNGAIMSFYDKQYQLLHQVFLDKRYEAFMNLGRGLTYHIRDGKIYAYANILAGIGRLGNVCFVVNPKSYTVETKTPDWGDVTTSAPTLIEDMFWFRDKLLEDRTTEHYMFGAHIGSYLVTAAYP
ncbi:hypothetical protein [Puia sp.]|jgi:hypothetical protein|uniref:hypothetical protein n=1 Tax=Puia sp. TaxID=2045100 RepID=UPI002F4004C8